MLPPNNPEIDPDLLSEKLKIVAAHRRRPHPLFLKPKTADLTSGGVYVYLATDLRARIKRIPLLGPVAVKLNRKISQITGPGLTWKQRLLHTPIIGPVVHWTYSIVRLNKIRHELGQQFLELRQMQQANQAQTNQRIDEFAALDIENRLGRIDALDIEQRLCRLESALTAVLAADTDRENRLAGLRQELRHLQAAATTGTASHPAPAQASAPVPVSAGFDMDAFYSEFEGTFRGSRADIHERLKVYLPHLAHMRGDESARIIDVGCGRGEWLELLRDEGLQGYGIDMNAAMVTICRERGLKTECEDAIAYLRRQPEGSVAAVTGFHIIEHLPFETLIALFDAALHAVRKDGLVIFETPNPENLRVGACDFYSDPTHLRPIVPAVAEFMVRQRGFARAEILRLHPYPADLQLIEDSDVARRLNQALYGPQDYAVIAWKTYAN